MINISCSSIVIMTLIFSIFLIKAYVEDANHMDLMVKHNSDCPVCQAISKRDLSNPQVLHETIIDIISFEKSYGHFSESKIKKTLCNTRDQVIRGCVMGIVDGSLAGAFNGAILYALVGGIVSGTADLFGWKRGFV